MPTDVEIAWWRLRSQRLTAPHRTGARDAVTGLLAVQAENVSQSAWAVAARTASMKRATTGARVTFTLAAYASWTPQMSPLVEGAAARYGAFLGLDPAWSLTGSGRVPS